MSATIVRVYITEAEKLLAPVFAYLHDEAKVKGVTVFRGITGFGQSGTIHSSTLIDLIFDLPLVIEFFDETDKVNAIIEYLRTLVEPGHIVSWEAKVYE